MNVLYYRCPFDRLAPRSTIVTYNDDYWTLKGFTEIKNLKLLNSILCVNFENIIHNAWFANNAAADGLHNKTEKYNSQIDNVGIRHFKIRKRGK